MSLKTTDRLKYLYVGLQPSAYANPDYKFDYTSYISKEDSLNGNCQECQVEESFLTAQRPHIGPYHKISKRYSDGMPPLMYNYSGQQKCSRQLHNECEQLRFEQYLRKYGLYWEVPWQKYKTKCVYAKPAKFLSPHEKNPLHPAYLSTDKVNSTLVVTPKGGMRYLPGVCKSSSRPIRTAFYEDDYPNWMYKPPNWTNYTY